MTLQEMEKKVFVLIEELNPESEYLTDDPDIQAKKRGVINQVLFELVRFKKIPRYVELEVSAGEVVTFETLEKVCGNEVYQIGTISGVNYSSRANGTVLKILETGTAQIDCFVYPERITDKTNGNYEFELSPDVLEIMPYGVAGDLLKSDVSTEYGSVYSTRYESMLQRLDPRYQLGSIYVEGGVNI